MAASITTTETCTSVGAQCNQLAQATTGRRSGRTPVRLRRAWQRGMATAEYAVGILAAVALALVLLKIFNDNAFFDVLLRFVIDLIGKVGGMV